MNTCSLLSRFEQKHQIVVCQWHYCLRTVESKVSTIFFSNLQILSKKLLDFHGYLVVISGFFHLVHKLAQSVYPFKSSD